jgi:hypothetical protein
MNSDQPSTVETQLAANRAAESRLARTFGLSSLLLVIAVLGVSLGVMRKSLGLGIPLALILTPACVRACHAAALRRSQGRPMGAAEATHAFMGSIGVMTTVGTAAAAGFVGTCLPVGFVMAGIDLRLITVACISGCVVGLYTGFVTLVRLWPWKE